VAAFEEATVPPNERTTEQGLAALKEFGFDLANLNAAGAPTPGRVADRLCDISDELEQAFRAGDAARLTAGLARLRRLRPALDAWDLGTVPRG
jgi:hypothetical protein